MACHPAKMHHYFPNDLSINKTLSLPNSTLIQYKIGTYFRTLLIVSGSFEFSRSHLKSNRETHFLQKKKSSEIYFLWKFEGAGTYKEGRQNRSFFYDGVTAGAPLGVWSSKSRQALPPKAIRLVYCSFFYFIFLYTFSAVLRKWLVLCFAVKRFCRILEKVVLWFLLYLVY